MIWPEPVEGRGRTWSEFEVSVPSKKEINDESLEKISLFCNVKKESVIPALNANSIYEVPSIYSKVGLDKVLLEHLGYNPNKHPVNLKEWDNLINKIKNLQN